MTSRPSIRCAGKMQECTGFAVDEHRAGAAVAGVAALLHLEVAVVAQEGAQALAGPRVAGGVLSVDLELHPASS